MKKFTNSEIIEIYKDIYNLPELNYEEEVSFDFFRLCKSSYNFVIISIYNERREFILLRDLNKNIGWELVGGYLKNGENIIDAANRIALKETGITVDGLRPVAIINNHFKFNNHIILHRGVAFIVLSREKVTPQVDNIKFIYTNDVPEKMLYQNKKILELSKKIVVNSDPRFPYYEIDSARKYFLSYIINKYIVKFIGRISSYRIRKKIYELTNGKPESILDVCSGDDTLIFSLKKKFQSKLCVANDISLKILSLLTNKHCNSNVIFTNHNILDFPFKKKFDLVIFKNSLHHIPEEEQSRLISWLSETSKQLIIIDIEDPNHSTFLSKIWHLYYINFLGDQGNNFVKFDEFKKLIEKNIKIKKIDFGVINTIKGRYYYSSVHEEKKGEEVEIKLRINDDEVENIIKILYDYGAVFKEEICEHDIYFTAPHRDFIATKECLRIRERNGQLELTYKGPSTDEMLTKEQYWKSEIDILINTSIDKMEYLLELLDFKKVADFRKIRKKFLFDKKTITLDKIENLGYFLEIEEIVNSTWERESAIEENIAFAKKFGLTENRIVNEPYRDLFIKSGIEA
ncbi:class IV adenylate cyclase [Patescibacteria group bacterium]|nr:class IV adenylate cyclase [Patescibacteria group bacterium]